MELWIYLLDSRHPSNRLLYAHLCFRRRALTFLHKYWISSGMTERQGDLSFRKLQWQRRAFLNGSPFGLESSTLLLGQRKVPVPCLTCLPCNPQQTCKWGSAHLQLRLRRRSHTHKGRVNADTLESLFRRQEAVPFVHEALNWRRASRSLSCTAALTDICNDIWGAFLQFSFHHCAQASCQVSGSTALCFYVTDFTSQINKCRNFSTFQSFQSVRINVFVNLLHSTSHVDVHRKSHYEIYFKNVNHEKIILHTLQAWSSFHKCKLIKASDVWCSILQYVY